MFLQMLSGLLALLLLALARSAASPPVGATTAPPYTTAPLRDNHMLTPTDSSQYSMSNNLICDMLFNAPVPPSIDQIPFYCICSYCRGTVGSKGDQGDRGPPGMSSAPSTFT